MTPEAARATVRMRRAARELEVAIEVLEKLGAAGEELPDVMIELQKLQAVLLRLHQLQRRNNARID